MSEFTKDTIPQDFTISLATIDAIPVILFCINCIIIGQILNSILFTIGTIACFISGILKVIWKYIVVLKKKNVWSLFIQMRIIMPIGFLIMLVGTLISLLAHMYTPVSVSPISIIFFATGFIGMVMMGVCGARLDSADLKSNWIEQIINSISQAAFLIGLLLI